MSKAFGTLHTDIIFLSLKYKAKEMILRMISCIVDWVLSTIGGFEKLRDETQA